MDGREREINEQLAGRYEIIDLLGRGGFASVYRVRNLRLQRTEALKVLSELLTDETDFAKRFEQEARVAASLDHPNIVKIYDYGGLEAFFWFSMQLVDGPSLGRRLKSGDRLDTFSAVRLGIRVLDALRYSHEKGVVHRDIKPDNILIDREGRPYLTDFGVAKSELALVKTQAGTLLGSPAYMSPEQLQGKPLDGRSDLYSVGVTLYKALAGELPFAGEDTFRATMKRLSEPPKPLSEALPGVDPVLEAILMRSLEREPADRFADAVEFFQALEQFLADAPRNAEPVPLPDGGDATLVLTPTSGSRPGSIRTPTWSRKPSGPSSSRRPTEITPARPPAQAPSATPAPLSARDSSAARASEDKPSLAKTPEGSSEGRSRRPLAIGAVAVAALALAGVLFLTRRTGPAEPPTNAVTPTVAATAAATAAPTAVPAAAEPTPAPTEEPTALPTAQPTEPPAPRRTAAPAPAPKRVTVPSPAPEGNALPSEVEVFPKRAAKEPPQIEQTVPLGLAPETSAKHRGESVGLSVTVGEDGAVKRATVISEVCPECDRAALEAAKRFRFKPARDAEGRPVEATMALSIRL